MPTICINFSYVGIRWLKRCSLTGPSGTVLPVLSRKTQKQHFHTKSWEDHEFKQVVLNHQLSIQNTARIFVMDIWLVFGSALKLLHVEIAPVELKQ